MITKIIRTNFPTYKLAYDVFDEEHLYGTIVASNQNDVLFLIDDLSVLDMQEVELIYNFMKEIKGVITDSTLDILCREYYYK